MIADRMRSTVLFGAAVAVGLAVVAIFVAVAGVLVGATTGADPADAFRPAPIVPADIDEYVLWLDERDELLRPVEPLTRDAVASAWVRADAAARYALEYRDTRPLQTWFTEGALERAEALLSEPTADTGWSWSGHELRAVFYSVDGRIMGVEAISTGWIHTDGAVLPVREARRAVLVLTDGNWRIQRDEVIETAVGNSTVS
ncbi:MAG: hypothetical protein HKN26_09465 [Acidimicrobiales bacterium]|nr:hypothetical protein [Acidimicrobiales bacterium]